MKITGAQAIIKALELENIKVIFGYPGMAISPFYDALAKFYNQACSYKAILSKSLTNEVIKGFGFLFFSDYYRQVTA